MTTIEQGPGHDESIAHNDWRTWLVSGLFTITLMVSGWVFASLGDRIDRVERAGSPPMRERMAAIEARQDALQRQLDSDIRELRETVKSINSKLDRLVEETHR